MSEEQNIFCYCLTCEKGFARKSTYLEHFSVSKNEKCRNAPTRVSAKSKKELENLKKLSVTSIKEHFQLKRQRLDAESNDDKPGPSNAHYLAPTLASGDEVPVVSHTLDISEILRNQKDILANQQKILQNQEKMLNTDVKHSQEEPTNMRFIRQAKSMEEIPKNDYINGIIP